MCQPDSSKPRGQEALQSPVPPVWLEMFWLGPQPKAVASNRTRALEASDPTLGDCFCLPGKSSPLNPIHQTQPLPLSASGQHAPWSSTLIPTPFRASSNSPFIHGCPPAKSCPLSPAEPTFCHKNMYHYMLHPFSKHSLYLLDLMVPEFLSAGKMTFRSEEAELHSFHFTLF